MYFYRPNCPGSWHDARISAPLFKNLLTEEGCPSPFRLVADSAFPCTVQYRDKILSVPKVNSVRNDGSVEEEIRNAVITKHRQPAEWGMHALQGGFGRLRMKLTSDVLVREKVLDVIWYLHNYRTRMVGINQTATVYQKLWQENQLS